MQQDVGRLSQFYARSKTETALIDQLSNPETNQSVLKALTRRITSLEIENSNLQNTICDLSKQVEQSQTKVISLEEKIKSIEIDKISLARFLSRLQLEIKDIKRSPKKRLSKPKPLYLKKLSSNLSIDSTQLESVKSLSQETDNQDKSKQDINSANMRVMRPGITYYYVVPENNEKSEIKSPNLKENLWDSTIDAIDNEKEIDFLSLSQRKITKPKISIKKVSVESESPKKSFEAKKLFENFLVLGLNKEDVGEVLHKYKRKNGVKQDKTLAVESKIVFDFADSSNMSEKVTPHGIEKTLASWNLLLTKYPNESREANSIFQKVVLKSQRKYNRRFICPIHPHSDEVLLSRWTETIEAVNHQNKLYAFCIEKNDFMLMPEEKDGEELFITTGSIYCLLTYYPIPQVAFDILTSVLNMIRISRQKLYYGQYKLDKKKIDFSILDTIIPLEVSKYLSSILEQNVSFPREIIQYNFNDERFGQILVKKEFPKGPQAYLELAKWGSDSVFNHFSGEDINFILSAMLLDRKIAFFSKKVRKLTSIINTFMGLLYPFKYLCTLSTILPLHNVYLFNTLPPIVMGVNRNEEYFWRRELVQYSDFIFVFVDSKTIYVDESGDEANIPTVDFINDDLKRLLRQVNPENSGFAMITNALTLSTRFQMNISEIYSDKKKKKQINGSKNDEIHHEIFLQFKSQLQKNIIDYLPHFSDSSTSTRIKQINELIPDEKLRKFFYAFQKTMLFSNYPESVNINERNN